MATYILRKCVNNDVPKLRRLLACFSILVTYMWIRKPGQPRTLLSRASFCCCCRSPWEKSSRNKTAAASKQQQPQNGAGVAGKQLPCLGSFSWEYKEAGTSSYFAENQRQISCGNIQMLEGSASTVLLPGVQTKCTLKWQEIKGTWNSRVRVGEKGEKGEGWSYQVFRAQWT